MSNQDQPGTIRNFYGRPYTLYSPLCCVLCSVYAGVHAAAPEGCGVEVDFFATSEALGVNLTRTTGYNTTGNTSTPIIETCAPGSDCNWPAVWSRATQETAADSLDISTTFNTGLIKVVLPRTVDAVLYFQVKSPYLKFGANVTDDACLGPPPSPARRLLADNTTYTVATPGTITYAVKIGGAAVATTPFGATGGQLLIPKEDYVVSNPDICIQPRRTGANTFTLPLRTRRQAHTIHSCVSADTAIHCCQQ